MPDFINQIDYRYIITFVILFAVTLLWKLLNKKEKLEKCDFLLIFVFAFYGTAVGHYTLLDRFFGGQQRAELDLFWSYRLAYVQRNWVLWEEICNNILLFIPFGVLVPWIFSRTCCWWKVILSGCVVSCGIELTQLFGCLGLFEYDDIFNNTMGTILGYGIFCLMKGIFRKRRKWKQD